MLSLRSGSTVYGVWVARFSMIAVFSLPLFAAWAMSEEQVPPRIRVFRLALTLLAAFLMGIMVFVRQRTLDRELIRLLESSRDSFDNLQRLQAQILQSEKLASVAQLVGGAAHELNNPITAMLGYSDLLLNTPLSVGTATSGGKNRPICSAHQIVSRQPDQFCPPVACSQDPSRSQYAGAHRRQADATPMGGSSN